MKTLKILALGVCLPFLAQAEPTGVLGAGALRCKVYLAKSTVEREAFSQWILGYLSGYSAGAGKNYLERGPERLKDLFRIIGDHCKENPERHVISAAKAALTVLSEEYDRNRKPAPQKS